MAIVYFAVAVLGSVMLGVILGTLLSRHDSKATFWARLVAQPLRLWVTLGAVVVASCAGALVIADNHVLVGVAVLVAAYALQLAAIRGWGSKGRRS